MRHLHDHRYSLFGLVFASDVPLDGLPLATAPDDAPTDVTVSFQPTESSWTQGVGETLHERPIGDDHLVVSRHPLGTQWHFPDDTQFLVEDGGAAVRVVRPTHFTVEDAVTYLIGPIAGSLLRARGVCCLHASVVDVGGAGVALVGPAGTGKSTLASALFDRGHRLVTEDVAAVRRREDGAFYVLPGVPFVKLWPRSAARFGELPRVTPNWEKRYLDASATFRTAPVPLRSICFIESGVTPRAGCLDRAEAVVELIANVYGSFTLTPDQRAADLDLLATLVEETGVWRVHRSDDFGQLGELVASVLETIGEPSCGTAAK